MFKTLGFSTPKIRTTSDLLYGDAKTSIREDQKIALVGGGAMLAKQGKTIWTVPMDPNAYALSLARFPYSLIDLRDDSTDYEQVGYYGPLGVANTFKYLNSIDSRIQEPFLEIGSLFEVTKKYHAILDHFSWWWILRSPANEAFDMLLNKYESMLEDKSGKLFLFCNSDDALSNTLLVRARRIFRVSVYDSIVDTYTITNQAMESFFSSLSDIANMVGERIGLFSKFWKPPLLTGSYSVRINQILICQSR